MSPLLFPDLTRLKASWTKYDVVKMIDVVASNQVNLYLIGERNIDRPVFNAVLGIEPGRNEVPDYWVELRSYPAQVKLFTLLAALFTHYENIEDFATTYSDGNMGGVFIVEPGSKRHTNIRSALVEGEASLRKYRREVEVSYNFSKLYVQAEIGKLFKEVLLQRLDKMNWDSSQNFFEACFYCKFNEAMGLTKEEFKQWINGNSVLSRYESKEKLDPGFVRYKYINAFKVKQWLHDWDDVQYGGITRKKPDDSFFMFKIDARMLRRLADVHRRKAAGVRKDEAAIQRARTDSRVNEIERYVKGGFPWSTLSENQQQSLEFSSLKMPGLLPTAIIANILKPGAKRNNVALSDEDAINIVNIDSDLCRLELPANVLEDDWNPSLFPIEIIDGQHRLWAFDEYAHLNGNYELPVIAFHDLDLTWQAYLFYTINIKPTKINTSLGYDLYPLLRTQDWLEQSKDGLKIYRDTRAQELVEALWIYSNSPWRNRINMVGDIGGPLISQAAFVRAISSSFLKRAESKPDSIGGLFGDALPNRNNQVLYWNRTQQAAFLIFLWQEIADAVERTSNHWAHQLRTFDGEPSASGLDEAFVSKHSLLARDQGVTGISYFANDFFYVVANNGSIDMNSFYWMDELEEKQITELGIRNALEDFKFSSQLQTLVTAFAEAICDFDWRTTSARFEKEEEKIRQMSIKGSSGYGFIRKELKRIFIEKGGELSIIASKISV